MYLLNMKMGKQFHSMILLRITPHIQMRINQIMVMTMMNIRSPCNDSDLDVGVGYVSFDDQNEAHPIDEPIEARPFQEFYEPSEKSP